MLIWMQSNVLLLNHVNFFCFLQVSGHLAATEYITIMTQDIVTLLQPVNRELGNDLTWVFLRCKITLESKPEKNPSWNRVEQKHTAKVITLTRKQRGISQEGNSNCSFIPVY